MNSFSEEQPAALLNFHLERRCSDGDSEFFKHRFNSHLLDLTSIEERKLFDKFINYVSTKANVSRVSPQPDGVPSAPLKHVISNDRLPKETVAYNISIFLLLSATVSTKSGIIKHAPYWTLKCLCHLRPCRYLLSFLFPLI